MSSQFAEKKIFIIGICGTGMSAIAFVLKEQGAMVSGSDRSRSDISAKLEEAGIDIKIGHAAENLNDAELVICSSAIPASNPELLAAGEKGLPIYHRNDFLKLLLSDRKVIAVAGTHGKTTTTSLITWLMSALDMHPGYIIGSTPKSFDKNGSNGNSDWFVIEADEYDHMFFGLYPEITVLTRVEHDHPDCFPTESSYFEAFSKFVSQTKPDGKVIYNADEPDQRRLMEGLGDGIQTIGYGTSEKAPVRCSDQRPNHQGGFSFAVTRAGNVYPVSLQIPGNHNVLNATAAFAVLAEIGANENEIAAELATFSGIARRFERIAEWNDITVIDDYGHHPTEIKATLSAARYALPNRRIIALWQPHTFSRTRLLLDRFAESFADADLLLVTNIYASREQQTDFGMDDLMAKIRLNAPQALSADTAEKAIEILTGLLQPGDTIVTLSAGDANKIGPEALRRLQKKNLQIIQSEIRKGESIAMYSNALCGGPAREIYIAKNQTDLIDVVTDYQASKRLIKVVGGLSNILFSDAGYDGLLVINRSGGMRVERRDDQVLVTVDSGMKLEELVSKTAQLNLTGMEWATKIPGSVGGAIYGNAGAYEGDIAHVLVSVQLLTEDNRLITLSNEEMKFGYRISVLKSGEIKGTLVSGTFALSVGDPQSIQEKIAEITEKRIKFNFGEKGSLGSVFKNPPGNYAGKLITECGLRGKRVGNVQITDFHGNIFVTYPGVRSSEFLSMMNIVKAEVHKQFGIDLTSEIEVQ